MELQITCLYPKMLSHYGDKGNILALVYRLKKRGINAIISYSDEVTDIKNADIIYLGGGTERNQTLVSEYLQDKRDALSEYIQNDGVMLAVCSGYEIIGKSFFSEGKTHKGLGLIEATFQKGSKRIFGNIIINSSLGFDIVGFENRNTYVTADGLEPLGEIRYSDSEDKKEGIIYKNLIGTHIHGPILPKNPLLADYIIEKALNKKYPDANLDPIDDTLENKAHEYIVNRFIK